MPSNTFFQPNEHASDIEQAIADWHILIVDDIQDNLDLLSTVFELRGASVSSALDGEDALELVMNQRPDLIVLDLAMPHMDGYQLKEILDKTPALCDIPVVAISAHQSDQERKIAEAAGFIGLIAKPFSITSIFTEIAEMLQKHQ